MNLHTNGQICFVVGRFYVTTGRIYAVTIKFTLRQDNFVCFKLIDSYAIKLFNKVIDIYNFLNIKTVFSFNIFKY